MDERLRTIWYKSQKLRDFFEPRFNEELKLIPRKFAQEIGNGGEKSSNFVLNALSELTQSTLDGHRFSEARERATEKLREELIAGKLELVGINVGSNSIEEPKAAFWLQAKINADDDSAEFDYVRYEKLRVISSVSRVIDKPIEKTAADYRREAVERCEKEGRVVLGGGPRSKRDGSNNIEVRTEVYRSYLKERYSPDLLELRGFLPGAFEATEIQYKKEKRQRLQGQIIPKHK